MPVYRYRSFEEAQRALWRFETGVGYYRMLADLFHLGCKLSPPAHPAGIFRFRSMEEANAQPLCRDYTKGCRIMPLER